MKRKRTLFCAIPHSPGFDSCFPLIERLQQRGKVRPYVFLGPRLRQVEPRAEAAVRAAGVEYVPASLVRLELLAALQIVQADALLTHSDPLAFGGKYRLRDHVARLARKPTVFVQHGMVQAGLHHAWTKSHWRYHAGLMLLWVPLADPFPAFLDPDVARRIMVTGLIKTNRLAPHPAHAALEAELKPWRRRLLICHNYAFESALYPAEAQKRAFAEWARLAKMHPDTLIILRGHRGKRHPETEAAIAALMEGRPNILRSERHEGLMRMATINDVMAVADRVITHPSTVVLDAIYDDKPVGIFDAHQPELACLPRAGTAEEITAFLDDPDPASKAAPIRQRYGEISQNLDVAADAVEQYLEKL